MNVIIFIIVLGVLVFVHELGHFLFAKWFGIRVDEFGFGYPPLAKKIGHWRGTDITLNWIPFGGFVKVFGESDDGNELTPEEQSVSLIYKPRWQQFLVMFGGILFNFIFAGILFACLYMTGITSSVDSAPSGYVFDETRLMVTQVQPDSPADNAGLLLGDEIKEYFNTSNKVTVTDETIVEFAEFINNSGQQSMDVGVVALRDEVLEIITITPETHIITENDRYAIGVMVDRVGEVQLGFFQSLGSGFGSVVGYTRSMFIGLWDLITGHVDLNNVSGPVGIAGQVGDSARLGFSYLVLFTALLSLNLAVLNLVPFPALDGGRILIILIESIVRRRINPKITNWINGIGFLLLIAFMLLITAKDIIKLF